LDDALLASRAAAGDLDSFGQLYDRYFIRVYDFAWRTLGDATDAAAATQEAFAATAATLASPGNAPTFRALLFAAAHKATLTRADAQHETPGGPQHEEAFGAFDVPDPAHLENAGAVRGDYELAALAWEGIASLTARDYALLDLHARQGLSANELAYVLGTSKKEAQTIVSRMTQSAEGIIETYVIARRGSCPLLREALAPFAPPPLEGEAREVAQAHIASCDTCRREREQLPSMLGVLAAFTAVAAPMPLKGDAWRDIAAGWRIAPAETTDVLFEQEPFEDIAVSPYKALPADGGAPPPIYPRAAAASGGSGAEWTRNKVMLFAAAAIGLLIFAFAGGAVITGAFGGGDGDGKDAAAADPTKNASPGIDVTPLTTITPGVNVETPTVDPSISPTATEGPTETPEAEDSPTPVPATAAPPTATPVPPSPTPPAPPPNPTPTRGALIPIGTPATP
jgi:DNA-directed RNA polymerase specialized sigma24 family protein